MNKSTGSYKMRNNKINLGSIIALPVIAVNKLRATWHRTKFKNKNNKIWPNKKEKKQKKKPNLFSIPQRPVSNQTHSEGENETQNPDQRNKNLRLRKTQRDAANGGWEVGRSHHPLLFLQTKKSVIRHFLFLGFLPHRYWRF